jgi:hypothetical protein
MSFLRDIRMILTLSCRDSSRLISDRMDRTLSGPERIALRMHLMVCRRCRSFGRNLRFFRDLLRRMSGKNLSGEGFTPPLTPEERKRIAEKVAKTQSEESL